MTTPPPAAPAEPIAPLILSLRDQRVLLDADLARLYGVETRALNQAMKKAKQSSGAILDRRLLDRILGKETDA